MSDAAQGPGWWQASDDRWYPPEQHPGPGWAHHRRPRALWWLVAAAVVVAAVAVGVTAASRRGSPAPSAPGSVDAGPPSGTPAQQQVLAGIDIRQSDVPSSDTVSVIIGGEQVRHQPTLDLCDASFPSEALRVARRQVSVVTPDGSSPLSTEAVLYRSPAATAQAFSELTRAEASCPRTFRQSPVAGEGLQKFAFRADPGASWPVTPGVERLAYDYVVSNPKGQSAQFVSVFLRRGPLLLGIYFVGSPGQRWPAVDGQTSMEGVVAVLSSRLAASVVPAS